MKPVALITGITGQDGWYLSRFLQEKGYDVHGLTHRSSACPPEGCAALHQVDLLDGGQIGTLLRGVCPTEVYHLAAQSHVPTSCERPVHTANVTGMGTLRMLEAVQGFQQERGEKIRFFQASSATILGTKTAGLLNEKTPWNPLTPYAQAKAFAHLQVKNYRELHDLFACNGVLFNHESPRRGEQFVTRKITRAAARIKVGLQKKLSLGNLDSRRDWGFAGDYVEAMWLMLQRSEADDYVISTGETHSVQEFVETVFSFLELDWREHIEVDQKLLRPDEAPVVCGDASKAKRLLHWTPKVSFGQLARMMTLHDLELAQNEKNRIASKKC